MANEIELRRPVDLDFTPAVLDFTNYEELKKDVQVFADKYKRFVFTRETKTSANQARTELKSILDSIESNRKRVKQIYNQPLDDFEQQIKVLTDSINLPLNEIRSGLKEIAEYEKKERSDQLGAILAIKLTATGISIDEIEIAPSWLNKGNWTDKLKPITKLEAEIDHTIELAIKDKKQRDDSVRILTSYCQSADIEPAGWISQLEFKSATEVMDLINVDIKRKKELAANQEAKRLAYETAQAKQQQDMITEPIVESDSKPELISNVIQVTGTLAQLNGLNEYLVTSGIAVSMVNTPTTDDLPF